MKYCIVGLLVASTMLGHAQQLAETAPINSPVYASPVSFTQKMQLRDQVNNTVPGQRMRNTGRTLTLLGAGLLVGGIAVASSAESLYYQSNYSSNGGSTSQGDPKGALGIVMMTGGAGMIVPGIIFWSKGSKKFKAGLQEAPTTALRLHSNGMSIRCNF
jgi:hypothetical protein